MPDGLQKRAADLLDLIARDLRQMLASGPDKSPDTVKLAWALLKTIKDCGEFGVPTDVLQGMVDMLPQVMGNQESSPDCRLLAQRLAQNIERWNGGSGVLRISAEAQRVIAEPMRLV